MGLWGLWRITKQAQSLIESNVLTSQVAKKVPIDKVHDALEEYQKMMTQGKFLLCPQMPIEGESQEESKE